VVVSTAPAFVSKQDGGRVDSTHVCVCAQIPFDKDGYPDFRAAGVVKKEVKIKFSGDRNKDSRTADAAAGFTEKQEGFTWHHHQDGTTMQLVPKNVHDATGHTGGHAIIKKRGQ